MHVKVLCHESPIELYLGLVESGMTMSSGRNAETCSLTKQLYACVEARAFHISIYTSKS
jgi:hypothetical protein